jgi:hypothetical protein
MTDLPEFDPEEIENAYAILEALREFFKQGGARGAEQTCNEAHSLIQEFVTKPASEDNPQRSRTDNPSFKITFPSQDDAELAAKQLAYDADCLEETLEHESPAIVDEESNKTEEDVVRAYRALADQIGKELAKDPAKSPKSL